MVEARRNTTPKLVWPIGYVHKNPRTIRDVPNCQALPKVGMIPNQRDWVFPARNARHVVLILKPRSLDCSEHETNAGEESGCSVAALR